MTLSALVKNACISVVITLPRIKVLESILSIYLKLHLKLIWSLSDFSWTSAWTSKSYVRERDCQHNGSSTANSKVKENFWTYPACRQWHSRSPWTSDFWKRCATKNITGKINLKAENEPWKHTENCFSIKCWVKSKCV